MKYRLLTVCLICFFLGSLPLARAESSSAPEQPAATPEKSGKSEHPAAAPGENATTEKPAVAPEKTVTSEQPSPAPEKSATTEKPVTPEKPVATAVKAPATDNDAEEEASPAPSITPLPIAIPKKHSEIRGRYALGLVPGAPADLADDHIRAVTLAAYAAWRKPIVQVAWYATGKKPGQGILAVGECRDGNDVTITRPHSPEEAVLMERSLCFPTSPTTLCRAYLDNEITADDDFQGKPVVFEAPIADIARGAFSRPYAFFPSAESSVTGLTCYFSSKDPNLRKIRKGLTVKVRGTVKGFLMQDVVLEDCDILSIQQ